MKTPDSAPATVDQELVPVATVSDDPCQNPHSYVLQTARANHRLLHIWNPSKNDNGCLVTLFGQLQNPHKQTSALIQLHPHSSTHHRRRSFRDAPRWAAPSLWPGDCRRGWSQCWTYRWCPQPSVCQKQTQRSKFVIISIQHFLRL